MKMVCECGGKIEETTTEWRGITVRAWTCPKCGEELIHPMDAQRALELAKAREKNELTVKFRKVGKSAVITVPQVLKDLYGIKEGKKAEWSVEGEGKFSITVA